MGTTLTGTTPQDTYDSLIKVTDNGPLSGSLKVLTDGLGNNSAISLSTAAASVTGTLAVTSGLTAATGSFLGSSANGTLSAEIAVEGVASTNTALIAKTSNGLNDVFRWFDGATQLGVFKNSGNVGIGTSAPSGKLSVGGTQGSTIGSNVALLVANSGAAASVGNLIQIGLHYNPDGSTTSTAIGSVITSTSNFTKSDIFFATRDVTTDTAPTERVRILSSGGITFNGDTAAANALDDYEEGTWTMAISFGGASVGVTYSNTTGTYTKIGRQVTVSGVVVLTSKGSSTGSVLVTGLPFIIGNNISYYPSVSVRLENVTFANQFQAYGGIGSAVISLNEITEAGVNGELTNTDFANNSTVMLSATYFV